MIIAQTFAKEITSLKGGHSKSRILSNHCKLLKINKTDPGGRIHATIIITVKSDLEIIATLKTYRWSSKRPRPNNNFAKRTIVISSTTIIPVNASLEIITQSPAEGNISEEDNGNSEVQTTSTENCRRFARLSREVSRISVLLGIFFILLDQLLVTSSLITGLTDWLLSTDSPYSVL